MKHHDSRKPFSAIRPGFTLTELLVVILIIAILATLAIFSTRRIREMADKANSTRNLAQLQIANISYATDHNGKCAAVRRNDDEGVLAAYWFQDDEYLMNLLGHLPETILKRQGRFPSSLLDPKVYRARKTEYDRVTSSYGMNDTGLPLGSVPGLDSAHNLNQIPNPARSMAFATATDYRVTYNSRFKWDFENPKDEKTRDGGIAYRHGDKILAVYFDGHVGELSKGDLEAIDKSGGKNNAFWNPKAK